jgi:hypothetical protein
MQYDLKQFVQLLQRLCTRHEINSVLGWFSVKSGKFGGSFYV